MKQQNNNSMLRYVVQLNFLVLGLVIVGYLIFNLKSQGLHPSVLKLLGIHKEQDIGPTKASLVPASGPDSQENTEK